MLTFLAALAPEVDFFIHFLQKDFKSSAIKKQ